MSKKYNFFISCQIGFEELVKNELLHSLVSLLPENKDKPIAPAKNLTLQEKNELTNVTFASNQIKIKVGGISAKLNHEEFYTFMMWTRLAARVLLVLKNDYCGSDIDLYNTIYSTNWLELIGLDFDFKVEFNGTSAALKNSRFSALRVKDGIVDYFQQHGVRPNVNTENPKVIIDCRLHREEVQVALDLSGALHRRYRHRAGFAPMRETLAANLILRTGWDRESTVYNPMCGSGVLAIEAAMIALNIAPGLYSEQYQLNYWQGHNPELLEAVKYRAQSSRLELENFKVYASDNDKAVLIVARQNADFVGLGDYIDFSFSNIEDLERQEEASTGLVIINPPYGRRLGDERSLYNTYFTIGEVVKKNFPGWIMGVISSSTKLLNCLELSANNKWKIRNSNLDCEFRVYTLRNNLISKATENAETKVTIDNDSQAIAFYNRLCKNAKRLNSYLKRNKVQNYRLYDADIPEYNFAVDHYRDQDSSQVYFVVQEYAASKEIALHKTVKRSMQALAMVQRFAEEKITDSPKTAIVIDKLRERKKGDSQYNKINEDNLEFWIDEYGCKFKVNLSDYIDTGIFLDNRDLRKFLAKLTTKDTNFLNLFAYTSTATVHVLKANARTTTSVDMSSNYCSWSATNISRNLDRRSNAQSHQVIRADVLAWLDDQVSRIEAGQESASYDLIFCDPPTFSNSKKMEGTFDVQRDHVDLLTKISKLLTAEGKLIFCNNKRGFKLDYKALEALGLEAQDITQKTMPQDFQNSKIHQAWLITFIHS